MLRGFALMVVLAGCAGTKMTGDAPPTGLDCPNNASTVSLLISPALLTRGAETAIVVTWTANAALTRPVATLRAGDGPVVEVEVPLVLEGGSYPYEYLGSLLNPFGAGAPAGDVGVLASAAVPSGCELTPTAATGFTLE